jgi:cytoskeletal protein RodZ
MSEFKQSGFGAVLRQRREELGLSLNDLAASTRVRKTYLQALEEENLQMLPGAAYAVGFLRIYARQLGLPVESLIAALAATESLEDHPALPAMGGDLPRGSRKGRRKKPVSRLLLFLLFFLLLSAGGYLYFRSHARNPQPPPAAVSPPESSLQLQPTPQPVAVPPVAVPPAPAQSTPQGQPATVPTELPVLPAGGAVVRMLPVGAGTMKVSLDSQEVREYELQPDQSLNWKVSTSLAVELSTPGLARVWVDQHELAVAEYPAFILKGSVKPEGRP